jgi:hypothetical protein
MADIKISQLPAATTPLAGTEQVPLVQSGTTKKVSVTDLRGTSSGVTAVTGTAPVVSSGGTTPVISMAAATTSVNGYLTSADWNTFNGKGSGTVTGVTATSPVVSSGGTAPVISIPAASTSANGYLTSADWNTFNGKYSTGGALGTPSSGTATNLTGLPLSTGVTGLLPIANGGTGTATPAIVAGTNVTVSGTWPNQTVNATASGSGTVTSVAATVPAFLAVTGSPITTSGTLAIALSGTALPLANGGTAATTAAGARSSILPTYAGNAGKVLAVNTGATDVEYISAGGTGTVTSVAVSGGTTGLTTSGGPITAAGTITLAGTLAVANGGTGVTTSTGTGNTVLSTSPTLVTPVLGTPTSATLTNATGLPISTGVSGLGTGVATFLATPTSANLAASVTDETGTGSLVFATSPTLVTPALGTPSALVGTNITGTAAGLTAGNVTTNANLTGAVTSVGNATLLGSFTSAQLATALTDETGTGSAVFATSPTFVTPILGTPTSGTATNLTGLPLTTGVTGILPAANGGTGVANNAAMTVTGSGNFAYTRTLTAATNVTFPTTGTLATLAGTETFTNKTITGTKETVFTITDAAAFEINPANGGIQTITLGANRTPAATNFTAGQSVTLMIDDGSAYAITWSTVNPTWVGASATGSAPTLATSGYNIIEMWKVSTTIYAAFVGVA